MAREIKKKRIIKIVYKKPWFWFISKIFFPAVDFNKHTAIFGDTIYTKEYPLPDYRLVHEKVHAEQCRYSKLYYLFFVMPRYILSKKFRHQCELEAIQAAYQFVKKKYGEKIGEEFLDKAAQSLSGPIYGNLVSYEEAKKQITNN